MSALKKKMPSFDLVATHIEQYDIHVTWVVFQSIHPDIISICTAMPNKICLITLKQTRSCLTRKKKLEQRLITGWGLMVVGVLQSGKILGHNRTSTALSWQLNSDIPLDDQATSTMTWYHSQPHYPATDPTSFCPIVIMPNTWLGSNKSHFFKAIGLSWPRLYLIDSNPRLLSTISLSVCDSFCHSPLIVKSMTDFILR